MSGTWNPEDAVVAANRSLKGLAQLRLVGDKAVLSLDANTTRYFDVVRCASITPANTLRVLQEALARQQPLVACPYMTPSVAGEFQKAGVPFIDSAGNVFLRGSGLLFRHTGERPLTQRVREPGARGTRAFQPTGLRFLYEVMVRDCTPITGTYRELNVLTGVSLGAIGWILNSLADRGFLTEIDGVRRLAKKRELLDQWCDAYRQRLRPKYLVGRFSFRDTHDLHDRELPAGAYWGGEVAAAKLTDAIRPELGTLYTEGNVNLCMAKLGLREDDHGNVELLTGFWHNPLSGTALVPPLLVYGDLITSGSSRNVEAARAVDERFLAEAFA